MSQPQQGNIGEREGSEQMDLSGEVASSRFSRLLGRLPYLLSSRTVIVFGILLFFYLFVFAGLATLLGYPDAVSTNTQLIFGNYTNVTSSVGAGIAAGASLTLLKHQRRSHRLSEAALDAAREARSFAEETHRLLHSLHPEQAAALGQTPGRLTDHAAPTVAEPTVAEPTVAEPTVAEPTVAEPTVAEPNEQS